MPFTGEARSQSAVLARYVSVDYVHELENGGVEIFLALCVSAPLLARNTSLQFPF